MKLAYITLSLTFVSLAGCATSIRSIDVSGKDPGCVRQCTESYSSCASSGSQIGFRTETLQACADSYQVCTRTCPAAK